MHQYLECSVEVHKGYTPLNCGVKLLSPTLFSLLLSATLFSLFVKMIYLRAYEACEIGVRCDDFSVPARRY